MVRSSYVQHAAAGKQFARSRFADRWASSRGGRFIHLRITSLLLLLLVPVFVSAGSYNIDRHQDGPFAFSISGIRINDGSTLTRESILFNDPTCPVSVKSHSTKIIYKDRGFRFSGVTAIEARSPIVAVQVRTILYDVFGQHMKILANTESKDLSPGPSKLEAEWRAYEDDVTRLLTTVTYVARVRHADGTQWIFDKDNLQLALKSLNLEHKIGDQEKE